MKFLFVVGIQRSGTTALANTLNWHDDIAVCIERFKFLINSNKIKYFTPELFDEDNLFDFSTQYTNCTPTHSERFADFYNNLKEQYGNIEYVGDKIANDPLQSRYICENFPNSKFVFIVRDIVDIACSWQTRADRKEDKWPITKTATLSVEPWNQFNEHVKLMHAKYPDNVFIVNYNRFFGGAKNDSTQIKGLMNFLNLPLSEKALEGFNRAKHQYKSNIAIKERNLSNDASEYVRIHSNYKLYSEVTSIAC